MSERSGPVFGKIIEGPAFRDCVHVALAPVEAGCPIRPGAHVSLTESGLAVWGAYEDGETIGIADPFLRETIQRGQWFWLFLYQNTITGMRHVWSHKAFTPKIPQKKE